MKTEKQQREAAAEFAKRWKGKGYEKGESQRFWLDLLSNVYGVNSPTEFVEFEDKVHLDSTSFIDVMIPSTHVMIEQKSLGKDLRKPVRQSDGTMLTPFQQARRYSASLPYSQRPRWIVTCNFAEFDVYDMESPNAEPQRIYLKDLSTDFYRLQFLVDTGNEHIRKEMEVSMKAGEIVGKIYDAFIKEYDKDDPKSLRYLNILCVRLVFCLYAEDAGIFGKHDLFHDYLQQFPTALMRDALIHLFDTLNTPVEKRSKYINKDLAAFPYTNGGLFAEEIEIPPFTDEIRAVLLLHASLDFDWSEISPTIFGGVFESTLNPETRRKGGMHYTSIENIHKVIDPLFLASLKREFEDIKGEAVTKARLKKLHAFQDKLASLTFFDPACGSGNFLTETYLSLRRLENEVIKEIYSVEPLDAFTNPIKVSIDQFYGIEINDFAVTVATTALWISESQMMAETERIVHHDIDFLPLKSYANIREGNALRMDWKNMEVAENIPTIHAKDTYVIPDYEPDVAGEPAEFEKLNLITSRLHIGANKTKKVQIKPDYIIGNPPFVGYSLQSKSQKEDILRVFVDEKGKPLKNAGKIDYVAAWFYKAAQMMKGTSTRAALVSTNSITQGEQVAAIWKPLKKMFGAHIDFAYRTFRWDSEASLKAHVHVVVIGFSCYENKKDKAIYDNGRQTEVKNINGYLMDAPDVFVESRNKALCDVPQMVYGNKPVDGGFLFLTEEEKNEAIKKDKGLAKFIKQIYGSVEYINNRKRYCLWLVGASPKEIREHPFIYDRVQKVREYRLASPKKATRISANWPAVFQEVRQPESGDYILVPRVSSERRRYVPMGFLPHDIIVNDSVQIIPNATLYHFGILESNVHMAWMRVVCGRLKSDYRYSKDVVYNNFPWPHCVDSGTGSSAAHDADNSIAEIEKTAQAILDAWAKYPDSSLADLYDPTTMPYDLLQAHRTNDRAVMHAYGFSTKMTEAECVARLLEMYAEMTKEK